MLDDMAREACVECPMQLGRHGFVKWSIAPDDVHIFDSRHVDWVIVVLGNELVSCRVIHDDRVPAIRSWSERCIAGPDLEDSVAAREVPQHLRRPICGGHARTLRETTLLR